MTCNILYLLRHGIFRCLLGLLITPFLKFVTLFTYLDGVSLHACVCVCMCVHEHITGHVAASRQLGGILSYILVGHRDQIQLIRLGSKVLTH